MDSTLLSYTMMRTTYTLATDNTTHVTLLTGPSDGWLYTFRLPAFQPISKMFPFNSHPTSPSIPNEPYVSSYPDPHHVPPPQTTTNNPNQKQKPPTSNQQPTPQPSDQQPTDPPLQTYQRKRQPTADSQQTPHTSAYENFQQSTSAHTASSDTAPSQQTSTITTRSRPAHLRQHPKKTTHFSFESFSITKNSPTSEPTYFSVANKDPKWRQAMVEEYSALLRNDTWTLVPPVSRSNVVDCKWVYKVKRDQTGNNPREIDRVVHSLNKYFAVQDMGPLTYFLGIEVQRHGRDILLSQRKYILDLLEHARLSKSKPIPSPITTTSNLALGDSPLSMIRCNIVNK
ncbi:unnamed protein product [Lactuca virosa]|uniref:Reverse transcriptase Ty1/copia-type domain-containing protein n=1 Tax=Lactuca virosa TaxID=75947 RepID=A0AAU9P3J4_9ASTR|nr:unnamed protein product [Lactuca virosa]